MWKSDSVAFWITWLYGLKATPFQLQLSLKIESAIIINGSESNFFSLPNFRQAIDIYYFGPKMLISQAVFSTAWKYLKSKPIYNKVLQCSLCSLAPPPAKASGSHQNTCWLCWNHWLYENQWVGEAGPPKYSTPWLVWTPIIFLFQI